MTNAMKKKQRQALAESTEYIIEGSPGAAGNFDDQSAMDVVGGGESMADDIEAKMRGESS